MRARAGMTRRCQRGETKGENVPDKRDRRIERAGASGRCLTGATRRCLIGGERERVCRGDWAVPDRRAKERDAPGRLGGS